MLQSTFRFLFIPIAALSALSGCTHPQYQTRPSTDVDHTQLTTETAIMADGYVSPIRTWASSSDPNAIVLTAHGFNDYSNAFAVNAKVFSEHGITTYALDQRGFGTTAQHGIWPGPGVLQSDLATAAELICQKHPNLPVYLLGESMGGAVILSALQQLEQTCVKGLILSAPAVWGWKTMPWWQALPLRFLAHTTPEMTLTGDGLDIHPSDNQAMLDALHDDPLVIKATRIDAMYGLTDLMESALLNAAELSLPTLILYGEHDEIIPAKPFCEMTKSLPDQAKVPWRMLLYPNGFHMLSRDLQGGVVIKDMTTWILNKSSKLPSGHEISTKSSRLFALKGCR